jgi:hypothetical protein
MMREVLPRAQRLLGEVAGAQATGDGHPFQRKFDVNF